MSVRKPGFQNADTLRNVREYRYGNSGADNAMKSRWVSGGGVVHNVNRNRFIDMPVTT